VKANLKWIEQEWNRWIGDKDLVIGDSAENTAKLFAAFCLERLQMEHEAIDKVG
jgi:hypothetical protein